MENIFETRKIKIEILSPIFIKGKSVNYGEGFLLDSQDNAYLINNDALCEYISDNNKIDEYIGYYNRVKSSDLPVFEFVDFLGISRNKIILDNFSPNPNIKKYQKADGSVEGKPINLNRFKDFLKENYNESFELTFRNEINGDDFECFNNKSLIFFLDYYEIYPSDTEIINKLAIGTTHIDIETRKEKCFIQNGMGEYFIPGATIKGAIRNALLWKVMSTQKHWLNSLVRDNITNVARNNKNSPSFSNIEDTNQKTIDLKSKFETPCSDMIGCYLERWRKTKNGETIELANAQLLDIFKVVKISDATFDSQPTTKDEELCTLCVDTSKNSYRKTHRIILHTIPQRTTATFRITIDKTFLQYFPDSTIKQYITSIKKLIDVLDEYSQALWQHEQSFFSGTTPKGVDGIGLNDVYRFYSTQPVDTKLLRIGWGGGMMTKTQFLHLDELSDTNNPSSGTVRKSVRDKLKGMRSEDAPKSRLLIADNTNAYMPLGWCKLSIVLTEEDKRRAEQETKKIAEEKRLAEEAAKPKKYAVGEQVNMKVEIIDITNFAQGKRNKTKIFSKPSKGKLSKDGNIVLIETDKKFDDSTKAKAMIISNFTVSEVDSEENIIKIIV